MLCVLTPWQCFCHTLYCRLTRTTSCLHNTLCCPCHPQVAGQGRGLFAARDLEYGEILFSEQPYLCSPALSKRKQVCYHCLKVLGQADGLASRTAVTQGARGKAFCSESCLSAAQHSYYQLESQLNLGQLEQYCEAHGERFPLLAARWVRGMQLLPLLSCVEAGGVACPFLQPLFPAQPALAHHHRHLTAGSPPCAQWCVLVCAGWPSWWRSRQCSLSQTPWRQQQQQQREGASR